MIHIKNQFDMINSLLILSQICITRFFNSGINHDKVIS